MPRSKRVKREGKRVHELAIRGDADTAVTVEERDCLSAWRQKWMWIPLVVGAVIGLISGIASLASADAGYEATGTAFVAFVFPPDEKDPFSGMQFVRQRIESYAELGGSPEVLQAVADDVGGRNVSDLAGQVTAQVVPGTVLVRVTARDGDRVTSLNLANSMLSHLGDAVVKVEAGSPDAVSPIRLITVQPAIAGPASPGLSDVAKAPLAGLAVGGLLGAAMGWMQSRLNPGRRRRSSGSKGGRRATRRGVPRSPVSEAEIRPEQALNTL